MRTVRIDKNDILEAEKTVWRIVTGGYTLKEARAYVYGPGNGEQSERGVDEWGQFTVTNREVSLAHEEHPVV